MMNSRQMALCGLLSALAAVILLLGGAMGIGTFAAPVLAMTALLPVLEECGPRAAGTAYAAVSILALLLVPDRELALVYAGFGWYPILRPRVARIPSRLVRTAVRLAVCNGVILVLYGLLLRLMGLTADLAGTPQVLNIVLLAMGILVFLLLDLVLERMTGLWRRKLRKRFFS